MPYRKRKFQGRFNLFLDPNSTAIEHVLTFHSLIQSSFLSLSSFVVVIFIVVIFFLSSSLFSFSSSSSSSFIVYWIIPKSTRPSLDLRSPSAAYRSDQPELPPYPFNWRSYIIEDQVYCIECCANTRLAYTFKETWHFVCDVSDGGDVDLKLQEIMPLEFRKLFNLFL